MLLHSVVSLFESLVSITGDDLSGEAVLGGSSIKSLLFRLTCLEVY